MSLLGKSGLRPFTKGRIIKLLFILNMLTKMHIFTKFLVLSAQNFNFTSAQVYKFDS